MVAAVAVRMAVMELQAVALRATAPLLVHVAASHPVSLRDVALHGRGNVA
jgi:hypothetical protein